MSKQLWILFLYNTGMEGKPKLNEEEKFAELMARIGAEHPEPAVRATTGPIPEEIPATEPKRDLFAQMYPLLAKKLHRKPRKGS